jgi:tripartite-type tricarboxylate transporter receptor subunit TctC
VRSVSAGEPNGVVSARALCLARCVLCALQGFRPSYGADFSALAAACVKEVRAVGLQPADARARRHLEPLHHGAALGVDAVAKSPADGYTLVLGQTSNLAINPALYAKLPYNPQKDLAPIGLVANAPLVIVVPTLSAFKTLPDLVAAAKAKPGAVNFASSGNGTVAHLTGEQLQKTAGVKFQHVPYKGANQALTDVMGGQVDIYVASVPTVLGQIRNGKLRPLAVTSAKRIDDLPQTPTVGESGYEGFDAVTWFGFLAPAGTPNDIVMRLNAEFNKALQQPDLRKRLRDEGANPLGGTPEQFAELIREDTVRWGKTVKESGSRFD